VKFVYTGGQNKGEICIQKVKAKEIFVYSISSILRIFLGSKQRLLLYIWFKSHVKFVYCSLKTMVNFVYSVRVSEHCSKAPHWGCGGEAPARVSDHCSVSG
jgi:hypothetical protein